MTPGLIGAITRRIRDRVPSLEGRVHGVQGPAVPTGEPGPLPYAVVSFVSGAYERHSKQRRHGAESVQVSMFAGGATAAAELADQVDLELSGGPVPLTGERACAWLVLVSTVMVKDPGKARDGSDIYHVSATYRATTERPAPKPIP